VVSILALAGMRGQDSWGCCSWFLMPLSPCQEDGTPPPTTTSASTFAPLLRRRGGGGGGFNKEARRRLEIMMVVVVAQQQPVTIHMMDIYYCWHDVSCADVAPMLDNICGCPPWRRAWLLSANNTSRDYNNDHSLLLLLIFGVGTLLLPLGCIHTRMLL
jgi:hypothetical protein